MTFEDFLLHRAPTYDAQGDFVRLVLADANFPADVYWEEMRSYFFHNFCGVYIAEAGEDVWKSYKQARPTELRTRISSVCLFSERNPVNFCGRKLIALLQNIAVEQTYFCHV